MEKTKFEKFLEHKGLLEVVALFLREGERRFHTFYIKKGTDPRRYCSKFAEEVERGENKMRRRFGIAQKLEYKFVQIVRG